TLGQPVSGTFLVDGQLHFGAGGDGVEEADALNKTAIARIAAVGHDQVVEGALLCAATGETDGYHVNFVPVVGAAKNRCNAGHRPERPRILRNIPAIANGFCWNGRSPGKAHAPRQSLWPLRACARSMIRQANHQNFGIPPPGNMPPMPRISLDMPPLAVNFFIIFSICWNCFSAAPWALPICARLMPPMDGNLSIRPPRPPMPFICCSWSRKSSRSKPLPFLSFLVSFSAFSRSMVCSACSIRLSTSP